jgi:hypothetical protein
MNNKLKNIKNILLSAIPYSVYKKYGYAWKGKNINDNIIEKETPLEIKDWFKEIYWPNLEEENLDNWNDQYNDYIWEYYVSDKIEEAQNNFEDYEEKEDQLRDQYYEEAMENYSYDDYIKEIQYDLWHHDYRELSRKYEEYVSEIEEENENLVGYDNDYIDTINPYVQNVYKELFNGKERIILSIDVDKNNKYEELIEKYDKPTSQLIIAYTIIIKNKMKNEYLEWKRYDLKALQNRCFIDEQNRPIRIGKMISEINKASDEKIHKKFENREIIDKLVIKCQEFLKKLDDINNSNDLSAYIIISRHPYDIAGQSTDRRWTSCQNLINKEYSNPKNQIEIDAYNRHVLPQVTEGGLVAYLVNEIDEKTGNKVVTHKNKLMIEDEEGKHYDILHDPIARINIKMYIENTENDTFFENINYKDPNWLLQISKLYRQSDDYNPYNDFKETVQNWLDDNWNNKIMKEDKNYYFNKDLYNEDLTMFQKINK